MYDSAPAASPSRLFRVLGKSATGGPVACGVSDTACERQAPDPELDAIIRRHGGLARRLARVHRRNWIEEEDLVAEGMLGLIIAWRRYDPTRGVPFAIYARWWVRARIVDFVAVNGRIGSLRHGRVGRRLCCELPKELRRLDPAAAAPPIEELARTMQVSTQAVAEFLWVYGAKQIRIHQPVPGTDGRVPWEAVVGSSEPSPEQNASRAQFIREIRRSVAAFACELRNDRDLQILNERVLAVDPVSLTSLGRRWGVTKQRVSQIDQRLRLRLEEHLIEDLVLDQRDPLGQDSPSQTSWDC